MSAHELRLANVSRRAFLAGGSPRRRPRARGRLPEPCRRPSRSTAPTACRTAGAMTRSSSSPSRADGTVTIICHRSEMGQGVRTAMPMIVADELEADWTRVHVVQAPGDEKRYGNQDTDGSRSMRHFFDADAPLRRRRAHDARGRPRRSAGACRSREVEAAEPRGRARPSGRTLGYGELAEAAAQLPVPAQRHVRLKDPARLPLHRQGRCSSSSTAATSRPARRSTASTSRCRGMLYAVVARPPVYGGKVTSVDAAEALKVPGVSRSCEIEPTPAPSEFNPLGGVAVVATQHLGGHAGPRGAQDRLGRRPERQLRLRRPIKATLEERRAQARARWCATTATSTPALAARREARRGRVLHPAPRARADGAAGRDRAHRRRQGARSGRCTQSPAGRARRWSPSGSACRPTTSPCTSRCSAAASAASPSPTSASRRRCCRKAMDGKPVKVTWTREDDLHHAYYHTVVGRAPRGRRSTRRASRSAWLHRSVAPTHRLDLRARRRSTRRRSSWHGRRSTCRSRSPTPHREPGGRAHTRIGWFRSVSNIPHAFAIQSFVAELAAAAGTRPEGLPARAASARRAGSTRKPAVGDTWNHGESPERYPVDTGRLRRVVETRRRDEAGWGAALPKGRGLGIAAHYSFVSYVAAVVEVAVDDQRQWSRSRASTSRSTAAPRVNPDRVRAQMEGAAIMGLGHRHCSARSASRTAGSQQDNFDDLRGHAHDAARRARSACTSSPATTTSRWAASASPACRRSRRRSATRSSRRPASASAACRSAISSRRRWRRAEGRALPAGGAARPGDDGDRQAFSHDLGELDCLRVHGGGVVDEQADRCSFAGGAAAPRRRQLTVEAPITRQRRPRSPRREEPFDPECHRLPQGRSPSCVRRAIAEARDGARPSGHGQG